jgi:hypothetical protein
MRSLFLFLVLVLTAAACKKSRTEIPEPPLPAMQYTDLQDRVTGVGQPALLDLDGDGHRDLGFSTLLVGNAESVKLQFYATGSFTTHFPINTDEESPNLPPGAPINPTAFPGYEWFNAPAILLAQRVEPLNGAIYWEGPWKTAAHRFFPFAILRDNKRYFGWIELSFDTTMQRTTLHRAAVSMEAEKGVKAGIK